jgi:hypothetical protein
MNREQQFRLTPPARPKPLRRGEGPTLSPEEREKYFGEVNKENKGPLGQALLLEVMEHQQEETFLQLFY